VAPPKPLVMDASGKPAEAAAGSSGAPAPSRFAYDTLASQVRAAPPDAGCWLQCRMRGAARCRRAGRAAGGMPAGAALADRVPPALPPPPPQQQEAPSTSSLQRGKDGHLTIGGGGARPLLRSCRSTRRARWALLASHPPRCATAPAALTAGRQSRPRPLDTAPNLPLCR
jgi:hypothetical protein